MRNEGDLQEEESVISSHKVSAVAGVVGGVIGCGVTTCTAPVVVGSLGVTLGAAVLAVPILAGVGMLSWMASSFVDEKREYRDIESLKDDCNEAK